MIKPVAKQANKNANLRQTGIDAATKVVANFSIRSVQYLDENANIVHDLPMFAEDSAELLKLFRTMLLLHHFDRKVLMLHRTGKIGTYPGTLGQEAVGVGMASALTDDDILVPYYRSVTDLYVRGVRLHEVLAFWIGDERGLDFKDPRARNDLPLPICISSQIPHAAGVANAIRIRGQKNRAVLTAIGDGGTSEGDFYEGLNCAGTWKLPLVIVINNNRWALTEPNKCQTACQTLAQKAIAGGFEGIQVDGNDVIAVRATVDEALQKARAGGGPTLIEALTYRLCAHTTIDNLERYVDKEEYDQAWQKEPLIRLRKLLQVREVLDEASETRMLNEIKEEIEHEVELALSLPLQPPEAIFDYLYAELPERQQAQRAEVSARWRKN
ncbi:MAG: thiamine pyrophosphate-dependent dehydrogenase E1 component subunit alpha [Gammaproteobacteria bacterium]|nr:thiamine pyrophosphate-dependent dehydrogenase E1 component subunit alpha [Gammaproteobacteria bacterium]